MSIENSETIMGCVCAVLASILFCVLKMYEVSLVLITIPVIYGVFKIIQNIRDYRYVKFKEKEKELGIKHLEL